jgi:hypothetical protein
MTVSSEDTAYAAGFFDGEGCITIGKNGAIDVRITNTAFNVLNRLKVNFGGTIGNRAQKVNKIQYAYCHYGDSAIEFIKTIRPYLIDKAPQADTILEYYHLRDEIKGIRMEGKRGQFANPDREALVTTFRDILSEQKREEH